MCACVVVCSDEWDSTDTAPVYTQQQVSAIVENCNKRAMAARNAQDQSDVVFLCALLKAKYSCMCCNDPLI